MLSVFVNSGPLIALGKLNRLPLLSDLYPGLGVPQAVYREVVEEGALRGAPDALSVRLWIEQQKLPILVTSEPELPSVFSGLGAGEQQVLALGRGTAGSLVLLDDEAARQEARRLGLPVKGTLGVLVQAYRQDRLAQAEVELLLLEIATRHDLWISERLCRQVLEQLFS